MRLIRILIKIGWALLVLLGGALGYLVLALGATSFTDDAILATVIVNTAIILVYLAARGLWSRRLTYRPVFTDINHEQRRGLALPVTGVFVLVFLAGQCAAVLFYKTIGSASFDSDVDTKQNTAVWLVLLFGLIMAPVAEELLLRGLIYPWLRQHLGVIASVSLTTIVFALIHGTLVQGIAVLPLGVLLALLYERFRSPWPGIAVHIAYNVAAVLTPTVFISALALPVVVVLLGLACVLALTMLLARLGLVTSRTPAEGEVPVSASTHETD